MCWLLVNYSGTTVCLSVTRILANTHMFIGTVITVCILIHHNYIPVHLSTLYSIPVSRLYTMYVCICIRMYVHIIWALIIHAPACTYVRDMNTRKRHTCTYIYICTRMPLTGVHVSDHVSLHASCMNYKEDQTLYQLYMCICIYYIFNDIQWSKYIE